MWRGPSLSCRCAAAFKSANVQPFGLKLGSPAKIRAKVQLFSEIFPLWRFFAPKGCLIARIRPKLANPAANKCIFATLAIRADGRDSHEGGLAAYSCGAASSSLFSNSAITLNWSPSISIESVPPCSSTMLLAIARPRPEPSVPRD